MNRYKLVIVDDELEVREGLRTFDFGSLGIEFAGCYENGLTAFESILKSPVDIVLTDIRMPLMNGLELVQHIYKQFGFIKTIILSGYDDFEYAKKCIKNGVLDYLLKPLDFEDLRISLSHAVNLLNEQRHVQARTSFLERKARLSAKLLRRNFLKEILYRSLTADETEEGSAAGEVMLESKRYTVSMLRLDSYILKINGYSDQERSLIAFALDNIMTEMWDEKNYGYHMVDAAAGSCYILAVNPDIQKVQSNSDQPYELIRAMEQIKQTLSRFRGLFRSTVSIRIGPTVAETAHIPLSREQAESMPLRDDACNMISVYEPGPLAEREHPERSAIESAAETYPNHSHDLQSSKQIIEEAKKYIRTHSDRSITLGEVAGQVHVNSSYLSYLFKQVTGKNYIHYVTACRIQRAKQLLADPQYKVYEVGEMVGYENPRYFSDIFKKCVGKTPHDYRNHVIHHYQWS